MDLNRLTRDADDLIRKVVSRYNQLYVPAGTISQLELDLMLDDLRKLYDTFKHIGQINLTLHDTSDKPEVKVNTAVPANPQATAFAGMEYSERIYNSPQPAETPPQEQAETKPGSEIHQEYKPKPDYKPDQEFKPEPKTIPAIPLVSEAEFIAEPEIEPEPVYSNQIPPEPEISETEKPVHDITENSTSFNSETAPPMLADKFSTGNKSLSESMASSQAQGGIGSRLLFQPISDLQTGIGLNDKFSFISDLFGNNTANYDEAITRINKAVNLDEAYWILQKYHSAEWEQKHESLARLKDFVKRRFI
jgi:hypothetical protein